ncbi:MAG: hypothetical protein ACRD4W_13475, partial [Nitrososphaeraceae archaeon]
MKGNAFQFHSVFTIITIFTIFHIGITAELEFSFEATAAGDAFSVQDIDFVNRQKDIFGISEIYPTVSGGREWFVNMTNPVNSSHFS